MKRLAEGVLDSLDYPGFVHEQEERGEFRPTLLAKEDLIEELEHFLAALEARFPGGVNLLFESVFRPCGALEGVEKGRQGSFFRGGNVLLDVKGDFLWDLELELRRRVFLEILFHPFEGAFDSVAVLVTEGGTVVDLLRDIGGLVHQVGGPDDLFEGDERIE